MESKEKKGKKEEYLTEILKAQDTSCGVEVLMELSNHDHYSVRKAVAMNPHCPPEILRKLAEDKYAWVRAAVAKNHNTPNESLARLARDQKVSVRQSVAKNPNAGSEILEELSKDEYWKVRLNIVLNENCHESALLNLIGDDNYYVQDKLIERIANNHLSANLVAEVLRKGSPRLVREIFNRENGSFSLEVLQKGLDGRNRKFIEKMITKRSTKHILRGFVSLF